MRRIERLCMTILFLLGVCFLVYPWFSSFWNSRHQSHMVSDYQHEIGHMTKENLSFYRKEARTYNRRLSQEADRWYMTKEKMAEYEKLLNPMEDGMMGYVEVPDVGISLPIYHGTEEACLQIGAGHMAGSSLPIGGKGSHSVIVGHTGLPSALLFTRLDELTVGQVFVLHVLDQDMYYKVDQILVVEPDDFSALTIEEDKDYCTLLTCTPYGINSHRLLVRGHGMGLKGGSHQAESDYDELVEEGDKMNGRWKLGTGLLLVLLLMILPVGLVRAQEYDKNDVTIECSLPGAEFMIYQIGHVKGDGSYEWIEDLLDVMPHIDLSDDAAAYTILGYVKSRMMLSASSQKSDEMGMARFKDLKDGIYLIYNPPTYYKGRNYSSLPVLLQLPIMEDGRRKNEVTISHKKHVVMEGTSLRIIKEWQGALASDHADHIRVSLFSGQDLCDEVDLSDDNDWSYEWTDLDPDADWQVVEHEASIKNCQVRSLREDDTIRLINYSDSAKEDNKKDTTQNGGPLPKTGQLWWPVAILSCLGLLSLAVAFLNDKR